MMSLDTMTLAAQIAEFNDGVVTGDNERAAAAKAALQALGFWTIGSGIHTGAGDDEVWSIGIDMHSIQSSPARVEVCRSTHCVSIYRPEQTEGAIEQFAALVCGARSC